MEKDPSSLLKVTSSAVIGAYSTAAVRKSVISGMFSKKPMDVEIVPMQVIDVQTLWGLWYNAEKFGINHYLQTNDKNNMDPMHTDFDLH